MKKKVSKGLKFLLSFALAAVLVYFAFRGVQWKEFFDGLMQTNWWYIALSVVVSLLALLFRQLRWHMMLYPLDDSVRQLDVWDADNIGNLANIVLPGVGEFTRCGLMTSKKAKYDKVFGTILMERIWDFLAIIILMGLALALMWDKLGSFFIDTVVKPAAGKMTFGLGWAVFAVVVVIAVLVWLVFALRHRFGFCDKAACFLEEMIQGFLASLKIKRKFMFFLYTALIWLMYILTSYYTFKAMPDLACLGFGDALFLSAIGNFASVIPVPGGIGAYHYLVTITMTTLYASTWELGILFATLSHEIHALILIVTGVISYVCWTIRKKRKIEIGE